MADESNPFADIYSAPSAPETVAPAQSEGDNPFADIYKDQGEDTSAFGAAFHSFERGIIPALTSIPGMGAGAEIGAGIGAFGGLAAPVTVPVGGILGGLVGALATSWAASSAQDFALKQLPESWQDALGQSQKQQQAEAEKQPVASFIGGLVPYALTMRPSFNLAKAALPENATAIQRLMANPLTAHLFGGAVTGGMELGSEAANKESPNWTKIGIATAFGTIFNTPTKIGEALTEVGARPARQLLGRPEPVAPAAAGLAPEAPQAPAEAVPPAAAPKPADVTSKEWNETLLGQKPPTVAQAGDAKVLGPGIDEAVFMGAHEQAPEALMTAQDAARTEASLLRPEESTPSVTTVARRMEPELFSHYYDLTAQRSDLQARLEGAPAVEAAALDSQLAATEAELRTVEPEIGAAYRRAADVTGSEVVEPPAPEPVQSTQPAPEGQVPTAGAPTEISRETQPVQSIAEQEAAIAADITRQLIAAGRPEEEAQLLGKLGGRRALTRAARLGNPNGALALYQQEGAIIRSGERQAPPTPAAPLMPTAERPNIAPEKTPENIPQNIPEPAQGVAAPEIALKVSGNSEVESLDPNAIGVDAERFQFKSGGDEHGVTERLQDISKWEPHLAGTVLVFRDEAGKDWIADGHQRLALARRLMAGGHPPIKINAFVLDARDGITDERARAIAAVKNIAEGTGTATDAAKVLRDAKATGIKLPQLPPRSRLVRDGNALAQLGPEAFGIVVNEAVPENYGAIVGRLVQDPADQVEALRLLARFKPDNAQQAELIVRDMMETGTEVYRQQSLFGEEAFAGSIVLERAKIADEALKQLRRDKSTFRTLVDEAERIQGAGGNVLDQEANQGRLSTDERAADFLKQLAFRAGPVSDALSDVARKLKSGDIKVGEAARTFLGDVRGAVENGVATGDHASGAERGAEGEPGLEGPTFFQRKPPLHREGDMLGEFQTERGQEGFGQAVIPGVKPITDADRLAAEAGKPLTGGAAPAAKGSLFDVEGREDAARQGTLFQPAYHGTPHIFDKFDSSKIGTGEGAQAFGHGLYFAGRKEVAEYYRTGLSRPVTALLDGKKLPSDIAGLDAGMVEALGQVEQHRTVDAALQYLAERHGEAIGPMKGYYQRAIDWLENNRARVSTEGGGRLYHVDIPHDDELLSWDKPLSEQSDKVKGALESLGVPVEPQPLGEAGSANPFSAAMASHMHEMTGEDAYKWLTRGLGNSTPEERALVENGTISGRDLGQAVASRRLRDAGVPGLRYLDASSRNPAGSGAKEDGTHNYVIFDDSRVNMLQYEQAKRGAITFAESQRPLIRLFKDADASTFLHESGHQWLEEVLRDAVHPQATDPLKADAATVRKWLGMKDDQAAPTTRQHERWARATEQYFREGVAPSKELAGAFAKFRTWLLDIYNTLRGLGAPISEDVRGVFDRLIEAEPNRTVISPEDVAREPSLPSIHEADAGEASAHEAPAIADRIVAEKADYLTRQPPEVQNELASTIAQHQEEDRAAAGAEPGAEAGAGAGGSGAVVAGGGPAGPESAGGPGGVEPSQELGSGRGGVSEGNGGASEPSTDAGLRNQRPQSAGAAGAHPLAPTPATLFGPAESPFVDKAGNIRIENLTSDQDVAQAIRDAAQENNEFIGDRRGVITDGQVLDLADALGMDASKLNQRRLGEAFNAEQVVAARKLLIQSATDVRDIMAKAASRTATDEDVLAYAHAKARHQMIQAQVAGITAEAGRALRAFRSLAGDAQAMGMDQFLRSATGKTLFQLKEEAKLGATLDTPMKVSKFVRDAQKRTFGSMVLEYWINGLISGPATHTTYMVGNVILSLEKAGPETLTAALIGNAARALGRQGEVVHFGEAVAKLRGAHLGIPAATKAAIDALRTGVTTRLPGETPRVLPFQPGSELARSVGIDESVRYSDAMPALYGAVQGIQDGIVSLGALLKAGGVQGAPLVGLRHSPLGAIPDIAVRGVDVLPLGTVARLPSRMIASIHSFFRTVNYSMEKNALAYRSAVDSGKTGTAFDAHVANLRQNPTADMMESAVHQATEATLMGKGSEFVQALSKLTNVKILGFPFLKFVDPFVHIAGNIIDQSIVQRSPLGLLSPSIREDLMGKNGTIAQDTAAARMLVGTALSIGFGSLAAQGLMSGSGPSDPREATIWRMAGNQAHSVRIGDTWYDIHRLGPIGMLGSVAADMYDVAHGASEGDMGKVGAALLQAFTHTMLDEGFGRGPADLIQALTDPQRYGPAYVRNQISSFVPFSVGMGQVARAIDPYSRQARSIMDAIKAKIPGLSQTLMPRRDIWGQALPGTEVLGQPGFSAIYTTQVNNDAVNHALLNLGIFPAQVDHKIRGVALTDEQFDQYSVLAGGMAKQQLDKIVNSPQWSQWPAQTQHDVIEATISGARNTAREMLMARFPAIPAAALHAKLAQLQPDAGE